MTDVLTTPPAYPARHLTDEPPCQHISTHQGSWVTHISCLQATSTAQLDETISVAVEAVGTERIDRNIITHTETSAPVIESDARRETRHIFQTPLTLVARGAPLPAGEKHAWTLS